MFSLIIAQAVAAAETTPAQSFPMIAIAALFLAVICFAVIITLLLFLVGKGKGAVSIAAGVLLFLGLGGVILIGTFAFIGRSSTARQAAGVISLPPASPKAGLSTSGALVTGPPSAPSPQVPVAALPDAFSAHGELNTLTAPRSYANSGLSRLLVFESTPDATVWEDLGKTPFQADVYPSISTAAAAAAMGLVEALEKEGVSTSSDGEKTIKEIHVTGQEIEARYRKRAVDHFFSKFRELYPDVLLSRSTDRVQPESSSNWDRLWVELSIQNQKRIASSSESPSGEEVFTGTLVVDASQDSAKYDIEVNLRREYVERKEWVFDFPKFARERPRQTFRVGYSEEFESSRQASIESVINKAESRNQSSGSRLSEGALRNRLVVDTFSQQLSRPYGTVWRSAVLWNLSGDFVAAAQAPAVQQARLGRTRLMQSITGLVVLFVLTIVMCMGANSLTQGYYRPWLVASGCLLVTLCGFLFLA